MTRTLSTGMVTAVSAETGQFCFLIEMQFGGGTANYTTAPHTVTATATGALASSWSALGGSFVVGSIQETVDPSGTGTELTLSGVDQTVINLALNDTYIGRSVKIWLAHLDASGVLIASPAQVFGGRMNGQIVITESPPTSSSPGSVTVAMRVQDMMGPLNEWRGIRLSVETHQAANTAFTADDFLSFVVYLGSRPFRWGGSWRTVGPLNQRRWVPS